MITAGDRIMTQEIKKPTYHRLLSSFKAIGPYLREDKSEQGRYFFDCLSVCVDDNKAPETREFWGWWMELSASECGYCASYQYGRYNVEGLWVGVKLHAVNIEEVERTRRVFHEKLTMMLNKDFAINIELDENELLMV
jgi:sigma factor-binding protein Crl